MPSEAYGLLGRMERSCASGIERGPDPQISNAQESCSAQLEGRHREEATASENPGRFMTRHLNTWCASWVLLLSQRESEMRALPQVQVTAGRRLRGRRRANMKITRTLGVVVGLATAASLSLAGLAQAKPLE